MRTGIANDDSEDPVLFGFSSVNHAALHSFAISPIEMPRR